IAFGNGALEALTYRGLRRQAPRNELFPNRFGSFPAGKRSLHDETSTRVPRVGNEINSSGQELLGNGACGALGESLAYVGGRTLGVAVNCLTKKPFLAAEGGIKTRAVDTHGFGQVGKCGSFVSLMPEYFKRTI